MQKIPMLKKRILTERLTVPIDKETKEELERLKYEKGVNVPEFIRQLLKEHLAEIKAG